jgi:hypothetical protein
MVKTLRPDASTIQLANRTEISCEIAEERIRHNDPVRVAIAWERAYE